MIKVFDNQPTRMPARVPRENDFTLAATVTHGQHPEVRSWISQKFVDVCRADANEVQLFEKTSAELL